MTYHFATVLSVLFAVVADGAAGADTDPQRDVSVSLTVEGIRRSYIAHLPPRDVARKKLPVVLAFHGGGTSARQFSRWTGLNDKADQAGFIAVYPEGTGHGTIRTWNAGICCGYAQRHQVDDVKFVKRLLEDLDRRFPIDRRRIYATGMSNGAMISYRLAQELSDRIAAIAPVAATMGSDTRPARPVPVMHIHGSRDEHCAIGGGPGKHSVSRTEFMAVADCMAWWIDVNQCVTEPVVSRLEDTANDGMRVRRDSYPARRGGAEVILLTVEGGGHTWPGRPPVRADAPRWLKNSALVQALGPSTRDISANDVIWEFFSRHALPRGR